MAYSVAPQQLDYFAHHEWADTPAKLLASMLEYRLDKINLFGAVVSGSSDVRTDYRLDLTLARLVQNVSGESSGIAMEIKASLIDVSNRSIVKSRLLSYTESTGGANPIAGVHAVNNAAEQFFADVLEILSDAIAPDDCD